MGLTESIIKEKSLEMGFVAVGITTADPFNIYIEEIKERAYMWGNAERLLQNASPRELWPKAKSIIVCVWNSFPQAFPSSLVGKFGRCYLGLLDDNRAKYNEAVEKFVEFLRREGLSINRDLIPPARMAGARAGVTNYGKNCFAYANSTMLNSSWLGIECFVVDRELEYDEPTIKAGCPERCKACIAACPTHALYRPLKMDPRKCIAYNTFLGNGITPMELRQSMGTWVYGCDICQEICPRNRPWLNKDLPMDISLKERELDFDLPKLAEMSELRYKRRVWPHFFFIDKNNVAKWQMNAVRALGNLKDRSNVPLLERVLDKNRNEIVRGMCAWALGKLGGTRAAQILEKHRIQERGLVRKEIDLALKEIQDNKS